MKCSTPEGADADDRGKSDGTVPSDVSRLAGSRKYSEHSCFQMQAQSVLHKISCSVASHAE
jgi:hypothetical protein